MIKIFFILLILSSKVYSQNVRFGTTIGIGGGAHLREFPVNNSYKKIPQAFANTSLTTHFYFDNSLLLNIGVRANYNEYFSFSGSIGLGGLKIVKKTEIETILLGGSGDVWVGFDVNSNSPVLGIEGNFYMVYNKFIFGVSLGYEQTPSYNHTLIYYGYKNSGAILSTIKIGFLL